MARAAPLYDVRFWRLFAGTVTLSAAVTSLALGPGLFGPAPVMDLVGNTLGLFLVAFMVGSVSAIFPSFAVWALFWRGLVHWRLSDRGRAILSVVVALISVPLILFTLFMAVAAVQPIAAVALVYVLAGIPAALIVGPALAAWIYKDAP